MSAPVKLLILILLIISACTKNEVLPQPPPPETQVISNDTAVIVKPDESVAVIDSGQYQYAEYKQMPYRILIPRGYDPLKSYPLHIFLHGISERGTDNDKQLTVGGSNFQVDSIRAKYPAFIIFPQCPQSYYWFSEPVMDTLKGLIDSFVRNNPVDESKISIGGFSMGAYGTFAMVAKYPGFFEAAVAISGEGDENKASSMTKPKWQIFAGKKDQVVPSGKSEKIAKALEKAGASVSFTLFENADHLDTFLKAFSEPDFFSRLFSGDKASASGPAH